MEFSYSPFSSFSYRLSINNERGAGPSSSQLFVSSSLLCYDRIYFSPLSLLYYSLLLSVGVYLRLLPFTAGVLYLLILDILGFRVSLFGPVLGELLLLFWS